MDNKFTCTLCGECCSGSMKVFLNPYDLYKMGRFLKLSHTEELFEKKLITWDLGQNGITLPRILFKTYPFSFCPFLINDFNENDGLRGRCSLHPDHKPLVCYLAPLTRELDLESGEDSFGFVPPHPDCPGCGKGERVDKETVKQERKDELEKEILYYRRLSRLSKESPEEIPSLFLFDLTIPYSP